MRRLRAWQARVRRLRERPLGELLFAYLNFLPSYVLVQEIVRGLDWATAVGGVGALALLTPFLWLWYRSRGTTRPIFLWSARVDLALFAAAAIVLHIAFSPPLWQTALLVLSFAAYEAAYRIAMPHSWATPSGPSAHDATPIPMSRAQKSAGVAESIQQQ